MIQSVIHFPFNIKYKRNCRYFICLSENMPIFKKKLKMCMNGFLIMSFTCLKTFPLISLKPELLLFIEKNPFLDSSSVRGRSSRIVLIVERYLVKWFLVLGNFVASVGPMSTRKSLNFSAKIFLLVTSNLLIIK